MKSKTAIAALAAMVAPCLPAKAVADLFIVDYGTSGGTWPADQGTGVAIAVRGMTLSNLSVVKPSI